MADVKCCQNGTIVSCDTCHEKFCDGHGNAFNIQEKWFCALHPPAIVSKRIDSGTSYISRWRNSVRPETTLKDTREELQREFDTEFDRARQIVGLCSKRLRDGGMVSYRGFHVAPSEISELRKGLNEKRRRFNKARKDVTRKACILEVVTFTQDLQSTLPEKRRTEPAECGSLWCNDNGCRCKCDKKDCQHHVLGDLCSCQNQDVVSNLAWMGRKEKQVYVGNKERGVSPPLIRVSGEITDKTLSKLKSFGDWKSTYLR